MLYNLLFWTLSIIFSFHAHCAQMQRVNQNRVVLSTRTKFEIKKIYFHEIFHLDTRALERVRGFEAILILVVVYRDTIMNFQTIQKVSVSPLKRALRSSGKRAAKKALKRASFKRSSVQTGSTAAIHAHGRYYFSPRGPQQSIGSGRCSS